MIIPEYYMTRKDGVNIYRRYSDKGVYIKQLLNGVETGFVDSQAFDVENAPYTYVETDILIETEVLENDTN